MESTKGLQSLYQDSVLILIIMEDTHGEAQATAQEVTPGVLILIIMEDTHGVVHEAVRHTREYPGLNPYYNGRYSWRQQLKRVLTELRTCLNPYYNGRYSWRNICQRHAVTSSGLNPYYNGRYSWRHLILNSILKSLRKVLILIIMEDTHGGLQG